MTSYRELKIRLEPAAEPGTYELLAQGPSGEVTGRFKLPWPDMELENFVLRLGRPRQAVRRVDSPEFALARRLGCELFEALFTQQVRDLYRGSFEQARAEGKGLRITLALTDAPELMHVPWEYLCDDRDFLSISTQTPVVRYLDLRTSRRPLALQLPLRILAMVSSPTDVVTLDVSRERAKLEAAVAHLTAAGAVEIHWLEDATLSALQRALRRGTFHIFHYIGHGGYDPQLEDGVLLLEEEHGRSRHASGQQLGTMLADHASLRLAVLNACEGARTSREDAFSGVATSLVRREIPAVIAMQFEITDRAAIVFAGEFYSALADGYPVDAALAEARKAIFADENDVEWATPVLFMRVAEGKIFDIPPGAASALVPAVDRTRPAVEAEDRTRDALPPREEEPEPEKSLPVAVFLVAVAAVLLIALANIFPWDESGRSFLDQKFHRSAGWFGDVLTSLSPFAIVAGALMTVPGLRRPGAGLTTAGLLIGFGVTGVAKYFGVLGAGASAPHPQASSVLVFLTATIAAASLVAVGTVVARAAPETPEPRRRDAFSWLGVPVLVMAAILILIGTVIPFNGGGTNPNFDDSHTVLGRDWAAIDPLAAALVAVAVLIPAVKPRRALLAGLLLAVGIESATLWLRYLGVPLIEDRTVASPAVGGFCGLLGATLVLGAGCLALWGPELGRAGAREGGAGRP